MKSSYNPREEIEELRAAIASLAGVANLYGNTIANLEEKLLKAERKIGELQKTIDRLAMGMKSAQHPKTSPNNRTIGTNNPTIGDISGYIQRKYD